MRVRPRRSNRTISRACLASAARTMSWAFSSEVISGGNSSSALVRAIYVIDGSIGLNVAFLSLVLKHSMPLAGLFVKIWPPGDQFGWQPQREERPRPE